MLALGSIATIDGVDSTPTNPQAVAQLGAGSVTAYGGGIEAFGAVPLGPFTVSLGAAAGLRGFSAPLLGFEATTCSRNTRRGRYSYACAETATTNVVAWVQPRIRFDVALDARRHVFLGGFLGFDALADFSHVGGLVLGLRL